MEDFFENFVGPLLALYLFLNMIPFLAGLFDSSFNQKYGSCYQPTSRIGMVMVGYRLGCYLGSPIDQ